MTLSDGRPQLFALTTELGMFVVRTATTNPEAAWTTWEEFNVP
ncbi:hypothetical protein [Streptomyces sp. NPDC056512]